MRAAFYEEFGGPEKLKVGERPAPEPGSERVLIRNRGAGVGYWDVKAMAGMFGKIPVPAIPGFEAAGVVEQTPAGSGLSVGDEVIVPVSYPGGGYAEYVVARAANIAPKPKSISFEEAASLIVPGGTAYEGLVDKAQVQPGETVLITAASGGVGTIAVQIAASLGARVFGVASADNHTLLRELGAAETFDYHDSNLVDQVRAAAPGGVDVLFDAAGGDTLERAVGAIRDGGRGVFINGTPSSIPRTVTGEFFSAEVTRERLSAVGNMVAAGQLRPVLEATYPLDEARQAITQVATRHSRGSVALSIP